MTNIPAFPQTIDTIMDKQGMTLRDYFAGQALVGLLAGRQPNNTYPAEHIAETSYGIADVMMTERGE